MRSRCGWYQSRTRRTCPGQGRCGSPSVAHAARRACSRSSTAVVRRLEVLERLEASRLPPRSRSMTRCALRRAHAGQQLQHAERGQRVARVVGPAQHRQQVLDVRRLEELEAAVLHERDLALRAARLRAGRCGWRCGTAPPGACSGTPASRRLSTCGAHVLGLRLQFIDGHVRGRPPGAAHRQQVLAVLARRIGHQRVGDIEHRLRGAVVLRQRDDLGLAA